MIRTTRRSLMAATLATPALAQDVWPSRPIRCIVPLPPGGGTDTAARIATRRLSEALGVPVVVENRPGAGGMVGTEAVARAAPDGYTIGIATSSSHPVAPIFRRDLPYDPVASFTPITLIGNTPYVLIGGPAAQAADFPALIARIKANPGQVIYASVGVTTLGYLLTRQFEMLAGIEMRHVPYRGSSQVYPDLLNGTVAVMLDNPPASAAMVRDGKFTAYAISRPSAMLPQVPLFSSFGIQGFDAAFWYGLMGPAGMPPAVAARMQQALAAAFLSGPGKAELEAVDIIPAMPTPAEFAGIVASDARKWRALADRLNIQPE
ncbi:tripartite tricarboxylate transporter substrate binding protein [Roseococcus sp. SYP-B2431]|uniref:Bug family tripartite tricarboxylate transporter substrate binding protein n=1 Tax=Roseococcus sp. SYP-B2431 TaxID=2496640 RepID=UPI00103E2CC5|nr:tripartite tricarboxylate transporter substrate-binding protein [Roseococcus sp. SYP-B2431]TCH99717.1 tripartite tricarboxylate transporter substrate binding protein [Roseococcus sp. SYP-B2431]